ncbi:MAG: response regulator transcription factor [Leptolyngbya sp. SIO4C5]|uniref:response regulator n=1 Tax=Sphaerothrix gracilis TaxID=3151835 RepID=UPI0013C0A9DA|nr:response regulator transcription factor [Leptolyngbya sp. SIO4C5]
MKFTQGYILLLEQPCTDLQLVQTTLEDLSCSVCVADTADQALAQVNQSVPYLIILGGDQQTWSQALIDELRQKANNHFDVTIVALTDSSDPSWLHREDNPGLDGFLVKPLSGDVLASLVQSAWAKQACR